MAKKAAKSPTSSERVAPAPAVPARGFVPLEGLIGQERALGSLEAAVASDRLHHAWVFHGPAGVGKFTAALAFGALLLDPLARGLRVDQATPVQALARAGNHPDLHIIRKELAAQHPDQRIRDQKQTNIPKAVLEHFLLRPATLARAMAGESAASKVFIVDEADLIDAYGQNALLKLLEEPPAGTVIFLVTSREDRLLPTIRSRTQRIAFHPLTPAGMGRWLDLSGISVPPGRKEWLLAYAAGSPGAAQTALSQGLHLWHETLAPMFQELGAGRFPLELGTTLAKLVDERVTSDLKVTPEASKDAANRLWARRVLDYVARQYQHQLRTDARTLGAAAADAIDLINDAERQLDANVRYADVMENLVAQLAACH